jgi:hypothetical protein
MDGIIKEIRKPFNVGSPSWSRLDRARHVKQIDLYPTQKPCDVHSHQNTRLVTPTQ